MMMLMPGASCASAVVPGAALSGAMGNSVFAATPSWQGDTIVGQAGVTGESTIAGSSAILRKRKVAFIGDSITWGYPDPATGYVKRFEELTGAVVQNLGVSGTHIAQKNADDERAFISRVNSVDDDAEMVVVMGGTNDFGHTATATPFGTMLDGANPGSYTFCAGVHNFFKALYDRFTVAGIPVVIVLPLHHGNGLDIHEYDVADNGALTENVNTATGKTYREYVDAIRAIAAYYSFDTIDAYSQSGINGSVSRHFVPDGLHIGDAGALKFAKFLIPKLEEVYKEFYVVK